MIARFLCLILLIVFSSPSWGLVATHQYGNYQYDGSYTTESTKNYNYGIVQKLLSERAQKTLESLSEMPQVGSFFAFFGDYFVTKRTTQSGIGVTRHSVPQKINRQVRSADELDAIKMERGSSIMLTVWAMYLTQEVGNCKLKEIAQAFSLKRSVIIPGTIRKLLNKCEDAPALLRNVERIKREY